MARANINKTDLSQNNPVTVVSTGSDEWLLVTFWSVTPGVTVATDAGRALTGAEVTERPISIVIGPDSKIYAATDQSAGGSISIAAQALPPIVKAWAFFERISQRFAPQMRI